MYSIDIKYRVNYFVRNSNNVCLYSNSVYVDSLEEAEKIALENCYVDDNRNGYATIEIIYRNKKD